MIDYKNIKEDMMSFKEMFESENQSVKEIKKIIKSIKTPLKVSVKNDDNLITITLRGKQIPSGVTSWAGNKTLLGTEVDENEAEFKKFEEEFSKKLLKKVSIEDYDFYIDNTEKATIFVVAE